MFFGTDLAVERQRITGDLPGLRRSEYTVGDAAVSEIEILDAETAEIIGKPIGHYTTVTVPSMQVSKHIFDGRVRAVADCLSKLLPPTGTVLVAGLGNIGITSDAFGPLMTRKIFATNHIPDSDARAMGFGDLRRVSVISPDVAGNTGMEASDIIRSICTDLNPAAVIAADALAAGDLSRVGCTFQLTDTGISPGSGVHNARKRLDKETLGVPVIAIGVPTVINAVRAAECIFGRKLDSAESGVVSSDYADTVVTVREADTMVGRAAALAAAAVNAALQPALTAEELAELTAE
ncbi:MAG: GPR endopeptidase [Clostridia bacterium]|nr:GPR endopeptidase [Clostridia bacterium]